MIQRAALGGDEVCDGDAVTPLDDWESLSDEELVIFSQRGSLSAFDELVVRLRRVVIAVAEQVLHDRDLAEDTAQESFLLALKALPQLEDPARFAAWICAIARNRARRIAIRECRSEPMEATALDRLVLERSQTLEPDPEERLQAVVEQEMVRALLAATPESYRVVLELYYYDDIGVNGIAAILGVPATTVKWRLRRGRQLLAESLKEELDESCPNSGSRRGWSDREWRGEEAGNESECSRDGRSRGDRASAPRAGAGVAGGSADRRIAFDEPDLRAAV